MGQVPPPLIPVNAAESQADIHEDLSRLDENTLHGEFMRLSRANGKLVAAVRLVLESAITPILDAITGTQRSTDDAIGPTRPPSHAPPLSELSQRNGPPV